MSVKIIIDDTGTVRCIYTETLDLPALGVALGGEYSARRASHVEPVGSQWEADMGPSDGPVLGPFSTRSEALAAEVEWLREHGLGQ